MKKQFKTKDNKRIKKTEYSNEEFPEKDEDGIEIITTPRELLA